MNSRLPLLSVALSLLPALAAQTQALRGKVEDVRNTANQFYLDGTRIPVVSTAVALNTILGQQSLLQVVNVGTAAAPVLRVDAAAPATPTFDMGNLRLGRDARWTATAPAGSYAFLFLNWTDSTSWSPFGGYGVWLLGSGAATLASGTTNAAGQFEIRYTMPVIPALVGLEMSGQALIDDHGSWFFSNLDGKVIEAQ